MRRPWIFFSGSEKLIFAPMPRKSAQKKLHEKRIFRWRFFRWVLLGVFGVMLLFTGLYLRQQINFFLSYFISEKKHIPLENTEKERQRIQKIISAYANQTFGMDISHYQKLEDISWDSLSIAKGSIPLKFVLLRATMGKRAKDKNFDIFWKKSREHGLIRGAYHFYRADEDPVLQANNFLESVQLESGDLRPVLDIERSPRRISREKLTENLKIFCKILEEKFGEKPIIYTYYHYYRDFLRADFQEYPLWLANYNDVTEPSPNDDWLFWQFTENGIVYGVDTKVDLDIFDGNIYSLKRLTLD